MRYLLFLIFALALLSGAKANASICADARQDLDLAQRFDRDLAAYEIEHDDSAKLAWRNMHHSLDVASSEVQGCSKSVLLDYYRLKALYDGDDETVQEAGIAGVVTEQSGVPDTAYLRADYKTLVEDYDDALKLGLDRKYPQDNLKIRDDMQRLSGLISSFRNDTSP